MNQTALSSTGITAAGLSIAILLPCCNEEAAIAQTVSAFRLALPGAVIYVYDNNSTDRTVAMARAAGAVVRYEPVQGKAAVVRRMFADIDADLYVMADGDATYDAASVPGMIEVLLGRQLDMVVGARLPVDRAAYRLGHRFGNTVITGLVNVLFQCQLRDVESGLRVFSSRFVQSFPSLSNGFEIEPEITVHALALKLPIAEFDTPYYARPVGSHSKLHFLKDGWVIMHMILRLFRLERPALLFGTLGALLLLAAAPTALLNPLAAATLAIGGAMGMFSGSILDGIAQTRREQRRMAYLSCAPLSVPVDPVQHAAPDSLQAASLG